MADKYKVIFLKLRGYIGKILGYCEGNLPELQKKLESEM